MGTEDEAFRYALSRWPDNAYIRKMLNKETNKYDIFQLGSFANSTFYIFGEGKSWHSCIQDAENRKNMTTTETYKYSIGISI